MTILDNQGRLRAEVLPFLDYLAEQIAERVLADPSLRLLATRRTAKLVTTMRVVVYARKSPHDDPNAASVERQVAHSRDYVRGKGWKVVEDHVHVDDSVSGAEFQNRPGLIRLLRAASDQPRPFDAVVMMEPERLGRDTFRTPLAASHLRNFGVRIFYYLTDEEERIESPEDELLLAIRGYRGHLRVTVQS